MGESGVPPEQILDGLRPLELPVELVLPIRGAPTDRAALDGALLTRRRERERRSRH